MTAKRTAAIFAVLMHVAAPAQAGCNPGDPCKMHYPQLPDLEATGLDLLATTHNGSQPPPEFGGEL